MPEAGVGEQYLHTNLFEMAAAYLCHIVQNHPFIGGNKRTRTMAAFILLKLNAFTLSAGEYIFEPLVDMVLTVAKGKMDKPAIAEFFHKHSR